MAIKTIDPKTLTEEQVIEAITAHCRYMGSYEYYRLGEIRRWRNNPSRLRVYFSADGTLHAYIR